MKVFLRSHIWYIASLLGVALVIKCIPLFRFGVFAYGHDYGFYRRYLLQPLVSFPNTSVPGLDHTVFLPRMFLDVLRVVFKNPDTTLVISYLVVSLISIWSVWFFAKQYLTLKVALHATILYILSGVQFALYTNFFFKEMVALPLFLGALVYFEKKRYGIATMLGVLVILTQQTTSIILMCIIALGFVFRTIIERSISFRYIFSGTAIVATYLLLHPHVAQKIASPPVGVFLSQQEYLLLSLPITMLAVFGFVSLTTLLKKNALLCASLTTVLVFTIFHLPFYNRIYAFLDIFLVVPAAVGVETIINVISTRYRKLLLGTIVSLFVLLCIPLLYLEYIHAPSIDTSLQQQLTSLTSLPSNSSIITSPVVLPWVQGWSLAKVYAPGNLKEPHSPSDWSAYWTHQDLQFEKQFLSTFPQPLYLFIDTKEMIYRPVCANAMSENLFSLKDCR